MAVAARGIRKESFAERRYHYPSIQNENGSPATARKSLCEDLSHDSSNKQSSDSAAEIRMPSLTLSKVQGTSNGFASQACQDHADGEKSPVKAKFKKSRYKGNRQERRA